MDLQVVVKTSKTMDKASSPTPPTLSVWPVEIQFVVHEPIGQFS